MNEPNVATEEIEPIVQPIVESEDEGEKKSIVDAPPPTYAPEPPASLHDGDDDALEAQEAVAETNQDNRVHMKVGLDAPWSARMWEVFTTFWPLGFIAFGGPQAHVAILRDHLVVQRDWLDEEEFTELFAIGQGLPGPTGVQLVISTALSRAGPLGGLLAFFLWTLPGMTILTMFGLLFSKFIDPNDPPFWLVGLPPAAISLVFKAFYGFGLRLDTLGILLALFSALVAILVNNDARIESSASQWVFPSTLALGGFITFIDHKRKKPWGVYSTRGAGVQDPHLAETIKRIGIPLWAGALIFATWVGVLVLVVVLGGPTNVDNVYLDTLGTMYRVGSIIFGGGQVVIPMLQDELVPKWVSNDQFLQGLGLAQSLPGPLFNSSAYYGAIYKGLPGALLAFLGLFSPGVLLVFAVVPFWARLRHMMAVKAILHGVNATAIGLVGAACVILWESAIVDAADAMVFCLALTLAVVFNLQAPFVVLAGGIFGAILHEDALDLGQVPYCVAGGEYVPVQD